jgi:hypothetical protein
MIKKNTICPKSGVKIHDDTTELLQNQQDFYNRLKQQNRATGVRITQGENNYDNDPFNGANPFNNPLGETIFESIKYNKTQYDKLDLNIDAYSREDLYKLFGLNKMQLTEENMREAKKIVLKTHPDKSHLEPQYFLFFTKAYKRLYGIYEFQNKSTNKKNDTDEYYDDDNRAVLDKLFQKEKTFKNPENFNKWFNEHFEKNKLDDDANETGYGEWLKSDEGIADVGNVSQANMASEMEKRKKQVKELTVYNGIHDHFSSTFGGSTLMDTNNNFTSGSMFSGDGMGYTDLRQAYVESVIPVTQDDFNKVQQFKNMDEYKRHRDNVDVKPISKEESIKQLYQQNKQKDEESAALAFYYARQAEKIKTSQESFWSGLKQLTNGKK